MPRMVKKRFDADAVFIRRALNHSRHAPRVDELISFEYAAFDMAVAHIHDKYH
jgi:hypothetical protein